MSLVRLLRQGVCAGLALACLATAPARAQSYEIDLSRLDPQLVMATGADVLRRAPDGSIDGLYQAVRIAAGSERESRVLCGLFEPGADRDVAAFQRAVDALDARSRERFAQAFTDIAVTGLQSPPQAYDRAFAQQVLRQTAVAATILHEGFMANLTARGTDAASREGRCRAFRQVVEILGDKPLDERAAATRWLLEEGLTLVAAANRR